MALPLSLFLLLCPLLLCPLLRLISRGRAYVPDSCLPNIFLPYALVHTFIHVILPVDHRLLRGSSLSAELLQSVYLHRLGPCVNIVLMQNKGWCKDY